MATILDAALQTFLQRPQVEFMGWDDRLDNGFCGFCTDETQLAFAGLLVRAVSDFSGALRFVDPARALVYAEKAANATRLLRAAEPAYGLHSAANAINANAVANPRPRRAPRGSLLERD